MIYDYYFSAKFKEFMKRNYTHKESFINGIEYTEMVEQGMLPITEHYGDLVKVHTSNIISNAKDIPTNICCEHFKTFIPLFSWFTINEDTLIMPNIDNIRVQYCPSCGKYIRDIQLSKRDSLQYFK